MKAEKCFDLEGALGDPRGTFGDPERVLADSRIDRDAKRAILQSWEQDERELAVATEEGMSGGEQSMLQRVAAALNKISDSGETRAHATTSHGTRF